MSNRYEYRLVTLSDESSPKSVEAELNRLGESGWDYVERLIIAGGSRLLLRRTKTVGATEAKVL